LNAAECAYYILDQTSKAIRDGGDRSGD